METKAEKFFEWLREQAQAGEYIKGYRGAKGLGYLGLVYHSPGVW